MPGPVQVGRPVDNFDAVKKEPQSFDLEEQEEFVSPASTLLRDANAEIRLGFVRKVYGILSAQLVLTVLIAGPICTMATPWLNSHAWLLSVSAMMSLVMICAISCCQSYTREYPTNYICLFLFTSFEAVVVGFVSAQYTWQSVVLCAGITAVVFLGLTVFAFKTKTDFTGAGPYLFAALCILFAFAMVLTILVSCGVPVQAAIMLYDMLGVLVFVFFIIYDTQLIIGGDHKEHEFSVDDYVFAALNLYLDIINLFMHLLRLLGEGRDA